MGVVPQFVNINQYYFMGGMPSPGGVMPGMGGFMPGAGGVMPGMGGVMPMMQQQPTSMDQFMYGINSQVAMATAGPYGGSVIDWANSLAAGQQQQGQQPGAGGGSGGGASDILTQIVSMLMQIIVAKVQERKAAQ